MARAAHLGNGAVAEPAERRESASGIYAVPVDSETLLAIEDVAELLKVPISWVYEHTRRQSSDRIPGFRLGKYWRFRRAEIMAWLERQRAGVKPNA